MPFSLLLVKCIAENVDECRHVIAENVDEYTCFDADNVDELEKHQFVVHRRIRPLTAILLTA